MNGPTQEVNLEKRILDNILHIIHNDDIPQQSPQFHLYFSKHIQ